MASEFQLTTKQREAIKGKTDKAKADREKLGWAKWLGDSGVMNPVTNAVYSHTSANNRIQLSGRMRKMPASDELGSQWTMRSFMRWAATGSSLTVEQTAKLAKLPTTVQGKKLLTEDKQITRKDLDNVTLNKADRKKAGINEPAPVDVKSKIEAVKTSIGNLVIDGKKTRQLSAEECLNVVKLKNEIDRIMKGQKAFVKALENATAKPVAK